MANFIVNGDIVEVATYVSLGSQIGVNVRHWRASLAVGGGADDKVAAGDLSAAIGPLYAAWFNANTEYLGLRLQIIKPTKRPYVTTTVGATVGAANHDPLPDQVAAVVKLTSGVIGRSKRGRIYLTGFTEDDNDVNNQVRAGTRVSIGALMNYLTSAQTVGAAGQTVNLTPIIWSRKLETGVDIAAYSTNIEWGTIRKRSPINRSDNPPVL